MKNVQRIEAGRQNLSLATLERIAAALEISPERLAFGAASPEGARIPGVLDRLADAGFTVRWATDRGRRPTAAVPVTTLRAAAGRLSGGARAIDILGWVVLPRRGPVPEGQFVAVVSGESMAPTIPSGAVCLFGPPGPPPTAGRILLVAHEALTDDDLGGPYGLKRLRSSRRQGDGTLRVVLESINRAFPPIAIDATDDELRIIAELVRVLVPEPARGKRQIAREPKGGE